MNAHATAAPLNDNSETQAVEEVFGDHAYQVPINSTSSMTGHLLGSAGVVDAIVWVKKIQAGIIHPSTNHECSDADCDPEYVADKRREAQIKTTLFNSFRFAGNEACFVPKRLPEREALWSLASAQLY